MIQMHKWYPFVYPKQYDIREISSEKRAERLEAEQRQEAKAQKIRDVVEAYDLELYNKRAEQRTVELEMFKNRKQFDKYA